jgi:spore germination cell wall hydrolase CwlJ-like protein
MCLAIAVYFEARSEPIWGQIAVAEVIVNRAEHPRFPDTVCAVVKEDRGPRAYDCQFSFYCDGMPESITNPEAWKYAQAVAAVVLSDMVVTDAAGGAIYYHTDGVSPRWSRNMEVTTVIGVHIFFAG